ncbi:hypothetical protein [Pontibacter sp. SGAir0037]|uniref:hypothetical protein n=1 Tax=Pontibacter sp. SGAir0037 TaxID=2571030 RepID=UPI0010CD076A|nr:hypothetical protein [Pontibacter sp. SGAir0037]QCR25158.1 hypothetical protein C1N53_18575 [Pontibacter sp. SGAir0037]
MKKVTVLAAAIAFFGVTSFSANAQSTQANTQQTQTAQSQDSNREKISKDQLPAAVQETLKAEAYQAWEVKDVYKVKPAEGSAETAKATYEIQFTNSEDQQAFARFNEDGTVITGE